MLMLLQAWKELLLPWSSGILNEKSYFWEPRFFIPLPKNWQRLRVWNVPLILLKKDPGGKCE